MMKFFRLLKSSPLLQIIAALIITLAGFTFYFYNQANKLKQNPQNASELEVKSLVEEIGKIMVLPKNETPTIATVSDPQALKSREFFVDAKKGDKVLMYTTAKKAILYDPVAKKIINVAPLTISNITETSTETTPIP